MPARCDRLVGRFQQRTDGRLRADRVLVARAAVPEVHRPLARVLEGAQVEHRRERLGRAAVDAHHVARVGARLLRAQHRRQVDEGVAPHRAILPGFVPRSRPAHADKPRPVPTETGPARGSRPSPVEGLSSGAKPPSSQCPGTVSALMPIGRMADLAHTWTRSPHSMHRASRPATRRASRSGPKRCCASIPTRSCAGLPATA